MADTKPRGFCSVCRRSIALMNTKPLIMSHGEGARRAPWTKCPGSGEPPGDKPRRPIEEAVLAERERCAARLDSEATAIEARADLTSWAESCALRQGAAAIRAL